MKKKISILSVVLLILLVVTFLVGCEPLRYYFKYDELEGNIEKIELINYDNPDVKEYLDYKLKNFLPYDFEKEKVLETLSQENTEKFLKELSKIQFLKLNRHDDSPQGNCIKVIYANGDFIIIEYPYSFCCIYNADGTYKEWIGGNYEKLIVFIQEILNQ